MYILKLCHCSEDTHTLYSQEQKNNSSKLNNPEKKIMNNYSYVKKKTTEKSCFLEIGLLTNVPFKFDLFSGCVGGVISAGKAGEQVKRNLFVNREENCDVMLLW